MSQQDIKDVQLSILDAIHEFCSQNSIKYTLACGSMLGAIRHKGYIPWDDDIDIYLLRDDFERLISLFPSFYKGHYQIVSLERDKNWNRAYAKAFDSDTVCIEDAIGDLAIGVSIDVYPIDEVPVSPQKWRWYNKFRRFLQRCYQIKTIKVSKTRSLIKNIILISFQLLLLPFSIRGLAQIIERYSKKYYGSGSPYVFECIQGMLQKKPFLKELFDELVLYDFEGHQYYGFKKYDLYLSNAYGNYMKLPPLEKRVLLHNFEAYWRS